MKTEIYYFTATGNSLKVAKDLARYIGNVELVQIRQEGLTQLLKTDADNIGFVVPTIFSGVPKLVHQFIRNLEISSPSPYVFAVSTHGDQNGAGIVFEQIDGLLAEKKLSLSASFGVQMPHNVPEKDHVTTAEAQKLLFEGAAKSSRIIAEHIQNHALHRRPIKKIRSFFDRMNYKSVHKAAEKRPFDRGFHVNEDCIGCSRCSRVCPADNIEMVEGKPKWKLKNCQFCFACVQWCPQIAIQYQKRTVGVKHYHHPDIRVDELYNR